MYINDNYKNIMRKHNLMKQPNQSAQFNLLNLAAYFPKQKILAIADLHIGLEEAYASAGQMIPKVQFKEIEKNLTKLLKETKPDKVILCGDIKHEFGNISKTEWRETLKVIDLIAKHAKLILVKGNHDTILGPIANKRDIEIVDYYTEDDLLFLHGDKLPEKIATINLHKKTTNATPSIDKTTGGRRGLAGGLIKSQNSKSFASIFKSINTIIIGHEHPAITLERDGRREKYKCFLVGKFENKVLLVLPSFNFVNEGTNVSGDNLLSPYLADISKFAVFIVGDEVYDFGTVKDIKKKFS